MTNHRTRQLAAIMFTDMVGYTAMMQENEQKAIAFRDRHRKVLEENTKKHNGKILQYYGDGTLTIYGSAIEAVLSAIKIQQSLRVDPVIPLRIGIHTGDIVFDEDGVYGDGVNVASRIESLAAAGSVIISEKVYDEIKNQPEFKIKAMGEYKFKNVIKPMEVFAICNDSLVTPSLNILHHKAQKAYKDLAVLPFVNMSNDIENEYFAEGISEELINALTNIDRFMVTARTSSFVFKGKNQDIREIGKALSVEYLVEGSVRKAGNRVRITAQLIRTKDGFHIWSEVYDRNLEDIFALQDEISENIVDALMKKLGGKEIKRAVSAQSTENIAAYNAYLKGRYYWNKFSPDSSTKAISCFEEAIKEDKQFALAYVGLAICHVFLAVTGYAQPLKMFAKARILAQKALKVDDKLGEAYFVTALVRVFSDFDWIGAEKDFLKALQLKPNSAEVHLYYGFFLASIEEEKKGMEHVKMAYQIDPLSLPVNLWLAQFLFVENDIEGALAQIEKILDLEPNFRAAIEFRGWIYYYMKDYAKAIENFKLFKAMTGNDLKGNAPLGCAYAVSGDMENAELCLQKLIKRAELDKEVSLDIDFAVLYLGLENYEKVFEHLKNSIENRVGILFLNTNPMWKKVRNDPRFQDLLELINIRSIAGKI